jgi:hypothetical protein
MIKRGCGIFGRNCQLCGVSWCYSVIGQFVPGGKMPDGKCRMKTAEEERKLRDAICQSRQIVCESRKFFELRSLDRSVHSETC